MRNLPPSTREILRHLLKNFENELEKGISSPLNARSRYIHSSPPQLNKKKQNQKFKNWETQRKNEKRCKALLQCCTADESESEERSDSDREEVDQVCTRYELFKRENVDKIRKPYLL